MTVTMATQLESTRWPHHPTVYLEAVAACIQLKLVVFIMWMKDL